MLHATAVVNSIPLPGQKSLYLDNPFALAGDRNVG